MAIRTRSFLSQSLAMLLRASASGGPVVRFPLNTWRSERRLLDA
jgi:hypothetical protein